MQQLAQDGMMAANRGLMAGEITVSPVFLNLIEQAQVPALVEGPIVDIQVKEGQIVEVGERLILIDDQRARFRTQQYELEFSIASLKATNRSEILLAEAESKVAGASLQRAFESRKKFPDTPSQAEVDEIQFKVAQARQHLEKATGDLQLAEMAKALAEKNLAIANYELELHKVKAPIKGAVVEIFAKRGDWVRPGDPLARVIRIDRLRVEGFVTRDKIRAGIKDRPVTVIIEEMDRENGRQPGKIVFVSPEIDPNDGRQRVVAEIDNPKGLLGPGLRATMLIHVP